MITITCPHCAFSKTLDEKQIPPEVARLICPQCKTQFPLDASAAPPPPGTPAENREQPPCVDQDQQVIISCPHCADQRVVPRAKIPDRPVKVLCKKCQKDFTFRCQPPPEPARPLLPPPRPNSSPALAGPKANLGSAGGELISIGELFANSWQTFKRRILTLLGINLLALVLALIVYLLLGSGIDQLQSALGRHPAVAVLAGLMLFGFSLVLVGAIGAANIYAIVDEDLGVRPALGLGLQRFWPYLWLFSLLGFIIGGGYLAFFIPGLVFTTWFAFAQFCLAQDDLRGMDALLKSREYVRGHAWGVAGRIFLLGLVSALVSLIPIVGALLSLFFVPFTMIYYFELYKNLQNIKVDLSYVASRGEKAKWLLAGAAGYVLVPAIVLIMMGPTLLQGLSLFGAPGAETFVQPAQPALAPSASSQSDGSIHIPRSGDQPEKVMVYIYAINYRGSVRLNGEELYPIEGERDMNYNFTGNATLNPGSNRFEVDYQALPDPSMQELRLKVFSHNWETGVETVHAEWTLNDSGGLQKYQLVLD